MVDIAVPYRVHLLLIYGFEPHGVLKRQMAMNDS